MQKEKENSYLERLSSLATHFLLLERRVVIAVTSSAVFRHWPRGSGERRGGGAPGPLTAPSAAIKEAGTAPLRASDEQS